MNSSTVRGSHRLDMVNGRHKLRSTSPLAAFGTGTFGAIKAIAVLAIAVSLGLVGTGGTYAYLNSSAPVASSSTISAGTATLTVGSEPLTWSALAPGDSVTGTFTIKNTGDVPLTLSAAIAAVATKAGASATNPLTISVASGACPSSGIPSGSLSGTVATGSTVQACIVVTLPASAPSTAQSTNVAVTATITGVQQ